MMCLEVYRVLDDWYPFGYSASVQHTTTQLYSCLICLHALSAPKAFFLVPYAFDAIPNSLQLRSSDWSSQSASPSQRQPALMHRPLSHMNSPERQGWWEAGETKVFCLKPVCAHSTSWKSRKSQIPSSAPPNTIAPPQRDCGIQTPLP